MKTCVVRTANNHPPAQNHFALGVAAKACVIVLIITQRHSIRIATDLMSQLTPKLVSEEFGGGFPLSKITLLGYHCEGIAGIFPL